jgi:hypothetical protein
MKFMYASWDGCTENEIDSCVTKWRLRLKCWNARLVSASWDDSADVRDWRLRHMTAVPKSEFDATSWEGGTEKRNWCVIVICNTRSERQVSPLRYVTKEARDWRTCREPSQPGCRLVKRWYRSVERTYFSWVINNAEYRHWCSLFELAVLIRCLRLETSQPKPDNTCFIKRLRTLWPRVLRRRSWPLGYLDSGFESSSRHGCLS